MLDDHATLLALRNQLLTTEIATTGLTTLAATGNTFTRTAGSFVADGFKRGMEVTPSGFTDDGINVIKHLTTQVMTLRDQRSAQAAGSGRKITTGICAHRSWENTKDVPEHNWYIEEEYIPGPVSQITIGAFGTIEQHPMYVVKPYGISNVGAGALYAVAQGIILSFLPRQAFVLPDSSILRVRSTPAPYRGQILFDEEDTPFIVVTIPLWVRTLNTI